MRASLNRHVDSRRFFVTGSIAIGVACVLFLASTSPLQTAERKDAHKKIASGARAAEAKVEQLVGPHVPQRQKNGKRLRHDNPLPHLIQLANTLQHRCRRTPTRMCYSKNLAMMGGVQERFVSDYDIDPKALIETPGSAEWQPQYSAVLKRLGVPEIRGVPAIIILEDRERKETVLIPSSR